MAKGICSDEDCNGVTGVPGTARGLCSKHYTRWIKTGTTELEAKECAADDCVAVLRSSNKSGYCGPHFHLSPRRREQHRVNEHNRNLRIRAAVIRPICAYGDCARTLRFNNKSGYCKEHHKFSPMRRENQRAYRQRDDRPCRYSACDRPARTGCAYCLECDNERSNRRKYLQRHGERERLFEMQDGLCPPPEWGGCGRPMSLDDDVQVDHIFPVARGGSDDESNKQLMHRVCNQSKRDKLVPALLGQVVAA